MYSILKAHASAKDLSSIPTRSCSNRSFFLRVIYSRLFTVLLHQTSTVWVHNRANSSVKANQISSAITILPGLGFPTGCNTGICCPVESNWFIYFGYFPMNAIHIKTLRSNGPWSRYIGKLASPNQRKTRCRRIDLKVGERANDSIIRCQGKRSSLER
jgi:hypothetical protein